MGKTEVPPSLPKRCIYLYLPIDTRFRHCTAGGDNLCSGLLKSCEFREARERFENETLRIEEKSW